jgi:hypothetical protein
MEQLTQDENRSFGEQCVQFMLNEQSKMSDQSESVFYIRWKDYDPCTRMQVQSHLRNLKQLGYVNMIPYIRPFDTKPVPGRLQVNILQPGMALIQAKVTERTVTTTTTATEKITEPLLVEETRQESERKRQFMRTERGYTIMTATNLQDLVNFHVMRRTEPGATVGDKKSARIWLDYIIQWRRKDLEQSPALFEKAQYYRDLPITRRKRQT